MVTKELLLQLTWLRFGDHRGCYRRRCGRCGKLFFASRPEARYCRSVCRQWAYRHRRSRAKKGG